jgi:hypothetical protein
LEKNRTVLQTAILVESAHAMAPPTLALTRLLADTVGISQWFAERWASYWTLEDATKVALTVGTVSFVVSLINTIITRKYNRRIAAANDVLANSARKSLELAESNVAALQRQVDDQISMNKAQLSARLAVYEGAHHIIDPNTFDAYPERVKKDVDPRRHRSFVTFAILNRGLFTASEVKISVARSGNLRTRKSFFEGPYPPGHRSTFLIPVEVNDYLRLDTRWELHLDVTYEDGLPSENGRRIHHKKLRIRFDERCSCTFGSDDARLAILHDELPVPAGQGLPDYDLYYRTTGTLPPKRDKILNN